MDTLVSRKSSAGKFAGELWSSCAFSLIVA